MSEGKDKLPPGPAVDVDEGWDVLDEAIEAAATAPAPADAGATVAAAETRSAAPPREGLSAEPGPEAPLAAASATSSEQVLSLHDRGKTDPAHPAVRPEDLAEFDEVVPTAKHLPRDLPTAPPGERRVAKTIMGVGTPELQAMIKDRLAGGRAPAPKAPAREPDAPVAPAPPAPATPTPRPAARPALATPTPRMAEKAAPATPTGPAGRPSPAQAAAPAEPPALADTDEIAKLTSPSDEVPPISALAAAPLAGSGRPPPAAPYAETSPAIEPHTVRMRPGGPAVTPTAATRRGQPERPKGPGPSNLALVLLWTVALVSVGLALYLYFARG